MPIAIATPYGHIGGRLTALLLDAGEDLILLPHNPDKLDADVRDRTTVRPVELEDAEALAEATRGADALFWLSPPGMHTSSHREWYRQLGRAAAHAVEANGIGHVVNLSSQGAQNADGMGPVSGLHDVEQALNSTDAAVAHLRPGFFMENFIEQRDAIENAGAVFFPAPPSTSVPMIATRDIADAAARLLRDRSWNGHHIVGLHGPRNYSYEEAATIIGGVLDRDLHAQQVPKEAVVEQFQGYGANDDWARGLAELYANIGSEAFLDGTEPRTAETTTPTTLRQFAEDTLRPALV
jgi:uncharacterized protein YbjT (DUF2867 family)